MNLDWDTVAYAVTWGVIYVAIPFWFIVAPGFPGRFKIIPRRTIGSGVLLSTLIMWPLMFGHRVAVEVPYNMARTNDPMYDGVGLNAAMLMMGWFLALIFEVPHIFTRLLLNWIYRTSKGEPGAAPDETAVHTNP